MGWERRRGGRRYYYRKVWKGGTCRTEYVGGGDFARLAAELETIDQAQRQAARADRKAAYDAIVEQAQEPPELSSYAAEVASLVAEVLNSLGFHRHKRQWRMQQMPQQTDKAPLSRVEAADLALAIYKKKAPSAEELAEFKRALNAHPALVQRYGDPSGMARKLLMDVFGGRPTTEVAVNARLAELWRGLGYAEASELERLLIDEVVLRWVDFHRLEVIHAMQEKLTLNEMEHWEGVLRSKQGRYLRAIESLARVRRLLKLNIQVNIAQPGAQQVNVQGEARPDSST